jgi:two-component system, OmpR family, sensor kinase
MSLSNRLLAFFLIGLTCVLTGFSLVLFLLAREYLHQQLDVRLEAALNTLMAAAEIEEGGLEWDIHERRLQVGSALPDAAVEWSVHSGQGRLVDASAGLLEQDPLRREMAAAPDQGFLPAGTLGNKRRCLRRSVSAPAPTATGSSKLYATLVFTVAASTRPTDKLLEQLATALVVITLAVLTIALFAGRWFCRRALRPVTEMAVQARNMDGLERAERLHVPASRDELEALGQSFNGLLDRLHVALERQRRFTGDASHQLRTPLTALLGQVEVALRHPRTADEFRQTLVQVQQQGQHLRQIVEMLLYLTRADAEAKLDKLAPLDLNDWLPKQLGNWSAHPRARDLQPGPPAAQSCFVQAQPPLLGQLLDNLIDNAFKYSEPGSPVAVRLEIENARASIIVEDRGIGIAEADLPHLFEPFFRSETARALGPSGVGLGLSIAQRIAQLFGGEIAAASRDGKGSRFTLSLPLLV